ncbi:MAG TPA: PAS domain-containing protein [Candidatus Thermoplasmatota archaeon]|nr:PAS domain-containing protein [Candidatus Thermoplasmatota archaeon]
MRSAIHPSNGPRPAPGGAIAPVAEALLAFARDLEEASGLPEATASALLQAGSTALGYWPLRARPVDTFPTEGPAAACAAEEAARTAGDVGAAESGPGTPWFLSALLPVPAAHAWVVTWELPEGFGAPREEARRLVTALARQAAQALEAAAAKAEAAAARDAAEFLLTSLPGALLRIDAKGTILEASPGAVQAFGYAPTELVGHNIYEFLNPEELPRLAASHEALLAEGALSSIPYRFRRKDGTWAWLDASARAVRDARGNPVGLYTFSREIPVSARQNLTRDEADRQLQEASRLARLGRWEWNLLSNTLTWSDELYRLYGVDPATFTPTFEAFMALIPSEDRARLKAAVDRALAERSSFELEHRLVRPDGSLRFSHARGAVVTDPQGRPVGLWGTGQDITDHKATEEAIRRLNQDLERSLAEFRILLHLLPIGVAIAHDREGRNVTTNAYYNSVLGFPPGAIVGSATAGARGPFRVFRRGREVPFQELPMQVAIATGKEVRGWDAEVVRADGTSIQVFGSAAPLFDEAGRVRGCIGAFIDITPIHQAEAELKQARRQLLEREKLSALGSLVAGVAHEVRTPLAFISNHVGLIGVRVERALDLGEVPRELAETILESTEKAVEGLDRINRLVGDLRRFTRLEVGVREKLPLDRVVGEGLQLLRGALIPTVPIDAHLEPTPAVSMDASQVQQVVVNLVQNAVEACQSTRGRVRVRTGPGASPTEAVLIVEDDGPGIPEEVLNRMWEPLVTTKVNGTGLGLSIVRRIVEEHQGTVTCESARGKGTRFTVVFGAHG